MAEKINMGNNRRGPGGPRGMMRPGEKSKDLKGALNKLLKYMGVYKWPMMIAAAFAMIGVILNLIGPDKLKDITKLITDGLLYNRRGAYLLPELYYLNGFSEVYPKAPF